MFQLSALHHNNAMQRASFMQQRCSAMAPVPVPASAAHAHYMCFPRHAQLLQPHRALPLHIGVPLIDLADANVFGQAWGTSVDVSTIASTVAPQIFAFSIFPYAGFLYCLTRAGKTPPLALFGAIWAHCDVPRLVTRSAAQAFTFCLRLCLSPFLLVSTPSKHTAPPWPTSTGCMGGRSHCSPSPTCWCVGVVGVGMTAHCVGRSVFGVHRLCSQVVLGFRKAIRDAQEDNADQESADSTQ